MTKEGKKYNSHHIKKISRFSKILFNRPIIKFVFLIIVYLILNSIQNFFSNNYILRNILNIIGILISIYFIIIIIYLIVKWVKKLINPDNIFILMFTYAIFIIALLLLFSTIFNIIETTGSGYIKFGECTAGFDKSMISSDTLISRNFFYFSAMTFFTVGYGDICPMGSARIASIIVSFIGHLVSVILVALILNNYMRKKENVG